MKKYTPVTLLTFLILSLCTQVHAGFLELSVYRQEAKKFMSHFHRISNREGAHYTGNAVKSICINVIKERKKVAENILSKKSSSCIEKEISVLNGCVNIAKARICLLGGRVLEALPCFIGFTYAKILEAICKKVFKKNGWKGSDRDFHGAYCPIMSTFSDRDEQKKLPPIKRGLNLFLKAIIIAESQTLATEILSELESN